MLSARRRWLRLADSILETLEQRNALIGPQTLAPRWLVEKCCELGVRRSCLHRGGALHNALLDAYDGHLLPDIVEDPPVVLRSA